MARFAIAIVFHYFLIPLLLLTPELSFLLSKVHFHRHRSVRVVLNTFLRISSGIDPCSSESYYATIIAQFYCKLVEIIVNSYYVPNKYF